MIDLRTGAPVNHSGSTAKAWLCALEMTAPIGSNRDRVISTVIEELAERSGSAMALLSEHECLTYRALAERSNRYARWALDQSLGKGDVVCLLMPNRPEYMAIWLGITSVGVRGCAAEYQSDRPVARPLHQYRRAQTSHRGRGTRRSVDHRRCPDLAATPTIWVHGAGDSSFRRIDPEIEQHSGETLSGAERRPVTIEDRALYIYTSGTTGLPKAANVSHARVMQWSHWFAGMMDVRPADRMYNCLPMYHSVGGVLAPGAMLAGGGSVVDSRKILRQPVLERC